MRSWLRGYNSVHATNRSQPGLHRWRTLGLSSVVSQNWVHPEDAQQLTLFTVHNKYQKYPEVAELRIQIVKLGSIIYKRWDDCILRPIYWRQLWGLVSVTSATRLLSTCPNSPYLLPNRTLNLCWFREARIRFNDISHLLFRRIRTLEQLVALWQNRTEGSDDDTSQRRVLHTSSWSVVQWHVISRSCFATSMRVFHLYGVEIYSVPIQRYVIPSISGHVSLSVWSTLCAQFYAEQYGIGLWKELGFCIGHPHILLQCLDGPGYTGSTRRILLYAVYNSCDKLWTVCIKRMLLLGSLLEASQTAASSQLPIETVRDRIRLALH